MQAHIGAGVRYNAQKQKVGNYYSTPIFGFRCKCHLCSGWFEIRTDPKNAAYVVHEGAKKKDEDWDPEANGGFAAHGRLFPFPLPIPILRAMWGAGGEGQGRGRGLTEDTEAPSASEPPADPFAHIEKEQEQQTWVKKNTSRITELTHASDRMSSDPYRVSSALRRKFREEKKIALEKQNRDDGLRDKFGIHSDVDLGEEDVELSREQWEAGRERRGLPVDDAAVVASVRAVSGTPASSGSATPSRTDARTEGTQDLAKVLRTTTAKKYDPFDDALDSLFNSAPKPKPKAKPRIEEKAEPAKRIPSPTIPPPTLGLGGGLLAAYDSD